MKCRSSNRNLLVRIYTSKYAYEAFFVGTIRFAPVNDLEQFAPLWSSFYVTCSLQQMIEAVVLLSKVWFLFHASDYNSRFSPVGDKSIERVEKE